MPRYTQPRKTWKYPKEFKIRAVKLSLHMDTRVGKVAEGLGIHPYMLSRWRKEYREGQLQGDGQKRLGMDKSKEKAKKPKETEVARLKREVELLKKENELLKKWQRYLAEVHQNDLDSSKDTEN